MKNFLNIFVLIVLLLGFTQCEDVLDKTDLGNITSDVVWNDPVLAEANLNRLYQLGNPGWPVGASASSDDSFGPNSFMYGRILENSEDFYEDAFEDIREVNVFLEGIGSGAIDQDLVDEMTGQALFWRAYNYWELVTTYGGVPLVLEVLTADSDLNRPRNLTSECVTQIIKDLDDAISLLPDSYDGDDFGRITKGTAMAYKGRVLMHYASERFDPNQSGGRWQTAYDALVEAKNNLDANGKGLHSSFSELWFDDSQGNPEIVWGRLYNTDNNHNRDAFVRPFQPGFSLDAGQTDNATISLLESFPMRDGKKIDDVSSAYTYDPVLIWQNRDPRFEATMVWNGAEYPIDDPEPFKTSSLNWTFQGNTTNNEGDGAITRTGFLTRKAIDPGLTHLDARESTTQWIEVRYAEVLLNLAEAANEVNRSGEALNYLLSIRERAGIENLDGRYGLDAGLEGDQDAMRDAILLERRIELAFEGKRSQDLIRRRLIEDLNGTERMGYFIERTAAFDALVADGSLLDDRIAFENSVLTGSIDLDDRATYDTYFTVTAYSVEENSDVPGQNGTDINFDTRYYFFDIPENILLRNDQLENTQGWPGGTFDPLL